MGRREKKRSRKSAGRSEQTLEDPFLDQEMNPEKGVFSLHGGIRQRCPPREKGQRRRGRQKISKPLERCTERQEKEADAEREDERPRKRKSIGKQNAPEKGEGIWDNRILRWGDWL